MRFLVPHIGDPLACRVCANECEQMSPPLHSSVIDDTGCLGCDAVLLGDWFPVFLGNVTPSSRVQVP